MKYSDTKLTGPQNHRVHDKLVTWQDSQRVQITTSNVLSDPFPSFFYAFSINSGTESTTASVTVWFLLQATSPITSINLDNKPLLGYQSKKEQHKWDSVQKGRAMQPASLWANVQLVLYVVWITVNNVLEWEASVMEMITLTKTYHKLKMPSLLNTVLISDI